MKKFQLEHIGITVSDPKAAAEWYQRVMGFEILHLAQRADSANAFVRNDSGTVLEFWKQAGVRDSAEDLTDPLQLHVAFKSEAPLEDAKYLMENGATLLEIPAQASNGDQTIALRDPWGNCIQLARRGATSFFRR